MLATYDLEDVIDGQHSACLQLHVVFDGEASMPDAFLIGAIESEVNEAISVDDTTDDVDILRVQLRQSNITVRSQINQPRPVDFLGVLALVVD